MHSLASVPSSSALSQTYSLGHTLILAPSLLHSPGSISCLHYCLLAQALLSASLDPSWLSPSAWVSAYIAVRNNPSFNTCPRLQCLPQYSLPAHGPVSTHIATYLSFAAAFHPSLPKWQSLFSPPRNVIQWHPGT